jgi:hypothetical protein
MGPARKSNDERDILLRPSIVAEHGELLVVRAGPYPHVWQAFPGRRFDVLTQVPVSPAR